LQAATAMDSKIKQVFTFDHKVYSLMAVKRAIYDLNFVADISLAGDSDDIIQVSIHADQENTASIEKRLKRAVINHTIRIDVEQEFGPIRKLILAQAFFPCENLDKLLDKLDL
jgi:His-Xaa-Ser system protein HxsD